MTTTAAIALGSNLGDRRAHLDYAVARLGGFLKALRTSSYFDTDPVDVRGQQPQFLNAAVVGETVLSARGLLNELLAIENERGRERPFPNAARTLDLDLVLYGNRIIDEPGLVVPHPRFHERRFVLEPLAGIAPDLVDPVSGKSVRALFNRLIR
jgi:2-amino-4-hydroxy-6-hydroxymethyldihydropteridine diphosphokinase